MFSRNKQSFPKTFPQLWQAKKSGGQPQTDRGNAILKAGIQRFVAASSGRCTRSYQIHQM